MKSKLGQILLWAGFLSGALATVFATATWSRLDLTVKNSTFFTIQEPTESEREKMEADGGARLSELPIPLGSRLVKVGEKPIASKTDLETELKFPVTLTYRESNREESEPNQKSDRWFVDTKTLEVASSTRKNLAELFGSQLMPKAGSELVVGKIAEGSSGWEAGLREGTPIKEIDGEATSTSSKFDKGLGGIVEATVPITFFDEKGAEQSAELKLGKQWATVNWLWYALSAVTCLAGVVLLHLSKRQGAGQSEKTQANLKQIKGNLENLVAKTGQLNKEMKDYKPRQILNFIENELADDFRDFADGRDSITAEYGLQVFAKVMTQFAAGERAINRAWSASADGYVEEAASCVARAVDMLETAKQMLAEAE